MRFTVSTVAMAGLQNAGAGRRPKSSSPTPLFEETAPWTYESSSMGSGISKVCEAQRKGQDHLSRAELGRREGTDDAACLRARELIWERVGLRGVLKDTVIKLVETRLWRT